MAFLLRDAKRGTRGGKKLAAAVAGRRSRRSRSSVRPNPFEAERWTAQMEIIWNTAGNNGISQMTTAAPCWSQSPCPSTTGFSETFFVWRHRGPLTPYLRDAIVGVADDDRPPMRCDQLGRVRTALYAPGLSRPGCMPPS